MASSLLYFTFHRCDCESLRIYASTVGNPIRAASDKKKHGRQAGANATASTPTCVDECDGSAPALAQYDWDSARHEYNNEPSEIIGARAPGMDGMGRCEFSTFKSAMPRRSKSTKSYVICVRDAIAKALGEVARATAEACHLQQ